MCRDYVTVWPLARHTVKDILIQMDTDLPGAASGHKIEIRISKYEQFQMTNNSMLQALRNPHLINALQLCILKNELKKQEVDRLCTNGTDPCLRMRICCLSGLCHSYGAKTIGVSFPHRSRSGYVVTPQGCFVLPHKQHSERVTIVPACHISVYRCYYFTTLAPQNPPKPSSGSPAIYWLPAVVAHSRANRAINFPPFPLMDY